MSFTRLSVTLELFSAVLQAGPRVRENKIMEIKKNGSNLASLP